MVSSTSNNYKKYTYFFGKQRKYTYRFLGEKNVCVCVCMYVLYIYIGGTLVRVEGWFIDGASGTGSSKTHNTKMLSVCLSRSRI